MDMLLLDPSAPRLLADLRRLGKIRGTARARYRDSRLDISDCGEKVQKLIDDAAVADGINILVKKVQHLSAEFEERVEALPTDKAKASKMPYALRHEISVRVEENPAFYQSLRKQLEAIIKGRRQEGIDAAEQHRLLGELREELVAEQVRARDIGLSACCFAIYGLLERRLRREAQETEAPYNIANPDLAAATDMEVSPLTELINWQRKDDVQRQMRSRITGRLRARRIVGDTVEALASDIVDLAKARTDL